MLLASRFAANAGWVFWDGLHTMPLRLGYGRLEFGVWVLGVVMISQRWCLDD